MLEGEVRKDSVVGIPVVDHNYTDHPARKTNIHYEDINTFEYLAKSD